MKILLTLLVLFFSSSVVAEDILNELEVLLDSSSEVADPIKIPKRNYFYSEELPTLFGIELGKSLPANVQIISKGGNVAYVNPPISYEFFEKYYVKIKNNIVVEITAQASNLMCLRSGSLEEMILKETKLKLRDGRMLIADGRMTIGEGENSRVVRKSESEYYFVTDKFSILILIWDSEIVGEHELCLIKYGLGSIRNY